MKKVYIFIITITLILFLSGCMSSPARRYYQLQIAAPEMPPSKMINRIVMIEPVDMDDLYDDYRIVFRLSPFEINYYSYEFWADKPDKLIRDSTTHYLLGKNIFQKVFQEISKGEPDILWKSKVRVIEEVDTRDEWFARLAMEVELMDFKSKERLYFYAFDRQEKLSSKNVALVPVAISKILGEELEVIVKDLAEKIE